MEVWRQSPFHLIMAALSLAFVGAIAIGLLH
jgi:hypothetical protein